MALTCPRKPMFNARLFDADGVFIATVDDWWQDAGVAGEVDSRAYHLSADDQDHTTERHDRLIAHGIFPLRFSPRRIKTDPAAIIRDLRSAIDAGRRRPTLPITALPARLADRLSSRPVAPPPWPAAAAGAFTVVADETAGRSRACRFRRPVSLSAHCRPLPFRPAAVTPVPAIALLFNPNGRGSTAYPRVNPGDRVCPRQGRTPIYGMGAMTYDDETNSQLGGDWPQVRSGPLVVGGILIGIGAVAAMAGLAVAGTHVAAATRAWIRELETPPGSWPGSSGSRPRPPRPPARPPGATTPTRRSAWPAGPFRLIRPKRGQSHVIAGSPV